MTISTNASSVSGLGLEDILVSDSFPFTWRNYSTNISCNTAWKPVIWGKEIVAGVIDIDLAMLADPTQTHFISQKVGKKTFEWHTFSGS